MHQKGGVREDYNISGPGILVDEFVTRGVIEFIFQDIIGQILYIKDKSGDDETYGKGKDSLVFFKPVFRQANED